MNSVLRKLSWIVSRTRVRQMTKGDTGWRAGLQLLAGEQPYDIEYLQQYGFAGVPLPGASGVYLAVGGVRGHGVALALDQPEHHPYLVVGEVAVYDDQGKSIILKRDGTIEVNAPKVVVNAPTAVVNSDDISLGGEGGPAVARIGDRVDVNGTLWPIVEGSTRLTAT